MEISNRTRLKWLAGAAALGLTGCGGGAASQTQPGFTPPLVTSPPPPLPPATEYVPAMGELRDAYLSSFNVGAAIEPRAIEAGSADEAILQGQFNSITAENVMKPGSLAPTEGVYTFDDADRLVDFALANGMEVRGHALLWHRATPDYFFEGTPADVRARLEAYVSDVVTHFKGRVFAWDVVNEVVSDGAGGTAPYRDSNWYQAAGGPDYIDWAFQAARAADPNALLFINDYSTELAGKRTRLLGVVQDLLDRDVPVDGIGHQMHIQRATPAADVLAAIDAVDNEFMGLINHVTELDISVYSDPASCFESQTGCEADYNGSIPQSVLDDQAQKYRDIFTGLADRSSVTSVTLWGLSDGESWLNGYPVDRYNAPLLYDRDKAPKKAFRAVSDPDFVI